MYYVRPCTLMRQVLLVLHMLFLDPTIYNEIFNKPIYTLGRIQGGGQRRHVPPKKNLKGGMKEGNKGGKGKMIKKTGEKKGKSKNW